MRMKKSTFQSDKIKTERWGWGEGCRQTYRQMHRGSAWSHPEVGAS